MAARYGAMIVHLDERSGGIAKLSKLTSVFDEDRSAQQSLRAGGTLVEVGRPTRGEYRSIGHLIKLSDSVSEVLRAPLLGEPIEETRRDAPGLIRLGSQHESPRPGSAAA